MNQIKKYPFLLDFSLGMALLLSILMIRIVLSFDYFFNIGMDPMFFSVTYLIFGLIFPAIIILMFGKNKNPLQSILIPLVVCGLLCPIFDGIWYTLTFDRPFRVYIYGGLIFGFCLGIIGSYSYFKRYDCIIAGTILILGSLLYIVINIQTLYELLLG